MNAVTPRGDRRIKRWLLILAILTLVLVLATGGALMWGWTQSEEAADAGQDLAVIVDRACQDDDLRESLGTACPKAEAVKEDKSSSPPLSIPGRDGRDGTDGLDGLNGADGRDGRNGRNGIGSPGRPGPPGPAGPPGSPGQNGVGEDGADGANGSNGSNGRGIKTMRLNDAGEIIVEFTDGIIQNFGPFIGPRGPEGPAGPQGESGAPGPDGGPGPQGPAGTAVPGTYECGVGQSMTGFTINTDGTVALKCTGDVIPEAPFPGNGN